MTVHMDLVRGKDGQPKHIAVRFPYNPGDVARVKAVPGRRFNKGDGDPHWRVPAELEACHALRGQFGDRLAPTRALNEWAWEQVRLRDTLGALGSAEDAELTRLPDAYPGLYTALRPYQRVGAAYVATATPGALLADQAGLGKTWQVIAGLLERDDAAGNNLVIAPRSSLNSVWGAALERLQPRPFTVVDGKDRRARERQIARWRDAGGGWLVINPAMIAYRRVPDTSQCSYHDGSERADERKGCPHCDYELVPAWPEIHQVSWNHVIMDECHEGAIRNPDTLTSKALHSLAISGTRVAMSGTPMKNRPIDLWGTLHWLDQSRFTSKWRWAEQWCEIHDNGWGKEIGGLREERKEELFCELGRYVLRRTKGEVAKDLPPKTYTHRWADMTPDQASQYKQWAEEAEIKLSDEGLTARNVLEEYTRAKQMATAAIDMDDEGQVHFTEDSGKLEVLVDVLKERGVWEGDASPVVVFSQWARWVKTIASHLRDRGVAAEILTGETSQEQRTDLQERFQRGEIPVLVMSVKAGGVAITLDAADTVVFTDELWSPADMEQAEDRVHRISRIHHVEIVTIRTSSTIDESIQQIIVEKGVSIQEIMDGRRRIDLFGTREK